MYKEMTYRKEEMWRGFGKSKVSEHAVKA